MSAYALCSQGAPLRLAPQVRELMRERDAAVREAEQSRMAADELRAQLEAMHTAAANASARAAESPPPLLLSAPSSQGTVVASEDHSQVSDMARLVKGLSMLGMLHKQVRTCIRISLSSEEIVGWRTRCDAGPRTYLARVRGIGWVCGHAAARAVHALWGRFSSYTLNMWLRASGGACTLRPFCLSFEFGSLCALC